MIISDRSYFTGDRYLMQHIAASLIIDISQQAESHLLED